MFFFIYSKDLKQENNEYLFLTADGIEKLNTFKEKFPELETLIISGNFKDKISDIVKICTDSCDLIGTRAGKSVKELKDAESIIIVTRLDEPSRMKELISFFANDDSIELAGHSYTNSLLDNYSKIIQTQLFPLMFSVSFLIILLLTRSLSISAIVFFPSILSALLSLSVIKFLFGSMNMVTSIVPLMSFVVTMCLGQHLYYGVDENNNVRSVLKYKKNPIFLMLLTTFIGFFSLALSSISVIRTFGMLTAVLIVLSSLVSILWFFLLSDKCKRLNNPLASLQKYYPNKSLSRTAIVVVALVSLMSILAFTDKVEIVTDATRYFPKSSKLKERIDHVSMKVGGIPIAEIGLKFSGETNYFLLKKIEELEQEISKKTGLKIISNNQIVSDINSLYSKNPELPGSKEAYLLLRSQAPSALKDIYPVFEESYHITLLGNSINVDEYESILKSVDEILKKYEYTYEVNGLYYNLMISQKEMGLTLFKSFFSSLLMIVLIAFLYMRRTRIIFTFLFVNTIPVGLSLAFIYTMGMSLNIATIMTYSISLGMVVDSSFHLIHALEHKDMSYNDYIKKSVTPIISSTLVLCLSFLLFVVEEFIPIREFGLNLFFIILMGLIFDLFVLPTLFLGSNKTSEHFNA